MTLQYRIEKRKIDVTKRKYVNMDPNNDRPDYDHLQIHDEYIGYKDAIYSPIDLPKINISSPDNFCNLLGKVLTSIIFISSSVDCGT